MIHVYVLVSQIKSLRFYVGMTNNIDKRITEHNSGQSNSTKAYSPWELFFFESFPDRKCAREREKHLKGGSGKAKIRQKWLDLNNK